MSIWKSPVFYFGILLALAVVAALAAPFVVDWNSYRADLESFGQKLTGRTVQINGPIAVRLFPWPRLEASDVHLRNPDGKDGDLLAADLVSVKVDLAGLAAATLRVDEIELTTPTITLQRDTEGEVNWTLAPSVDLRKSALLDDVKLDKITVSNGTLRLIDSGKAFASTLTDISADLSAPAITGPWRARGAVHAHGTPVSFTMNSTEIKAGQDTRFSVKLVPESTTYPDLTFDGTSLLAGGIKGHLLLSPHADAAEKTDQEGEFRPLTMQADVEAGFDEARLTAIKITPADVKDSSTLIEGETVLDFRNGLAARSILKAPRLNADALLGAQSLEAWRVGGIAGFLNTMMQTFPEKLSLDLQFDATALTLARQTLESVSLGIEAARNAVRVKRFASSLPGQSKILFNGIVFPGEQEAELGGSVAFESPDMRGFSEWVLPSQSARLKSLWNGERGHLKFQSDISLTGQQLGLQNLKYELDGFAGNADIYYRLGVLPSLDVRVESANIDVDSFVKDGIAALPGGPGLSWADVIGAMVQGSSTIEKRFTVRAAALNLNGVQARDVAIDVSSGLAGLDIKALDIGSVAGARLAAAGQILNGTTGPLGEVTARINATDPIGILTLLGIAPSDHRPRWTMSLGATDFTMKALVSEGSIEPRIRIEANGTSGPFTIAANGTISQLSTGRSAHLNLDGSVTSRDGAELVRALGLAVVDTQSGEGRLALTGGGSLADGLSGKLTLAALGLDASTEGNVTVPPQDGPSYTGVFAVAGSEAANALRAIGVPVAASRTGPMQVSSKITYAPGSIKVDYLSGQFAGDTFSGSASIAYGKTLAADIEVADVALKDLLALGFLSWQGREPSFDSPFSLAQPFGLDGEVWIRSRNLALYGTSTATEAVAGFSFDSNARHMSLAGRSSTGEKLSLDVSLSPKAGFFELQSSGVLPGILEDYLTSSDIGPQVAGKATLDWSGKGTGLTPFAALSDFAGTGALTSPALSLVKIAPQSFASAVPGVTTADSLSQAIGTFENGPGFDLGAVVMPLSVTGGVVKAEAVSRTVPNGTLELTAAADLPSGEMTATAKVNFTTAGQLPSASVLLSGVPGAIARRSLSSELAAKLGYEFLARDLAELEKVQKQQQEMIAKEELQRQQDQAKFEAYQAQKAELRQRLRELKIFAGQRARDQAAVKSAMDELLSAEPAMTNAELARRRRELKVLETLRNTGSLPPAIEVQPLILPQ